MATTNPRRASGNLLLPSACLAASLSMLGCKAGAPAAPPLATVAPVTPVAPPPADESPASVRFALWLAAFNSADRDALLAYHRQYFAFESPSAAEAGADRDLRVSRQTGGFTPSKQEEVTGTRVAIILADHSGRHFARAVMEVEAAEPHRVSRFELKPALPPEEGLSAEDKGAMHVDAEKRRRVLDGAARALRAHYVFPDVAEKMIRALDDAVTRGAFDGVNGASAFAQAVGKLLHDVSGDGHLRFVFGPPPPPLDAAARRQAELKLATDLNFGFGPIERLEGNVAKVVIYDFPPTEFVRDAIGDFMTRVADADALIVDLRDNHGGFPPTVALVASYLFDPTPVHLNDMYRRDDDSTTPSWTLADVPGTRFGGKKPVYVLTSKRTFSGGEELAYDLKALRRALLIGETTGGGANPAGPPIELGDWFRISVPWGRPINPITKTNWEGVGVVPDVSVPADAALEHAHRRALSDLKDQRAGAPPSVR